MTAPPPRRPWWNWKGTWAAVKAVWLPAAYLLSIGPAWGLVYRGLVPSWAWRPMALYTRPYSVLSGWERNPASDTMRWYVRVWLPERKPPPPAKPTYRWSPGDPPPLPAP